LKAVAVAKVGTEVFDVNAPPAIDGVVGGEIPDVLDDTLDARAEMEPYPEVLEVLAAGVACLSRAPFVGAFSDAASSCGGGGDSTVI